MARNQSRRLKPAILQADEKSFAALQAIKAYAPVNQSCSVEALKVTRRDVTRLRELEAETAAAAAAAREKAVAKEWEFHNLMLCAKHQVIAQFGADSDELQLLGRKKRSEYKTPGRKAVS
jgi:hypothetical protein